MKIKKKYFYWSLVLVFILILVIPKISFQDGDASASQANRNAAVDVEVLITQTSELSENLVLNGSLRGDEEVELRPEAAGKVIEINFDEGERVSENDLLVKINDADLQAQLKRTKSQKSLAEDKENRSKQLLEQNLISQEEYDIIKNELNARSAEIDLLMAQIDKTEIRAPFDGIVGLRWVSEGSFINSSVSVALLTKTNPIKVDFALPIKHANKVNVGDVVKVIVPNSEEIYSAKIYAIDPKVDPSTRTLQIRALANNPDGILLPGSYAEVELILDSQIKGVSVPTQSVVPDIAGEMVYLYKNGKAVPAQVRLGLRTSTEVQIVDGVNPGDTVITSAIIQLRPGVDVSIRNYR